jgi:hypothetical protein
MTATKKHHAVKKQGVGAGSEFQKSSAPEPEIQHTEEKHTDHSQRYFHPQHIIGRDNIKALPESVRDFLVEDYISHAHAMLDEIFASGAEVCILGSVYTLRAHLSACRMEAVKEMKSSGRMLFQVPRL